AGVRVTSGQLALTNGSNTFGGHAIVSGNAATLSITSDGALGAGGNSIALSGGGALQAVGSFSSGRTIAIGTASSGVIDVTSNNTLTFDGSLSGAGTTSLLTKRGTGTLRITSASTYDGNVAVSDGALTIATAAGGSLANVGSFAIGVSGKLLVDHQDAGGGGDGGGGTRGAGGSDIVLDGGTFSFQGADNTLSAASFGTLYPRSGASTVQITNGALGTTSIGFSSLTPRGVGATLDVLASGLGTTNRLFLTGVSDGPLGSWFTVNSADFAQYSAASGVSAFGDSIYNGGDNGAGTINVFAGSKHVLLQHNAPPPNITDPPATVGTVSIRTLKIDTVGTQTIDVAQLSGSTLTLSDGGLIKVGVNAASIAPQSGVATLTTTASELNITVSGATLTIASNIGGGSFTLTKRGSGVLTLAGTGASNYTGATVVSGTMELNKPGAIAIPGDLTVAGGTVISLQDEQIADTGKITLNSGTFDLNGRTETVAALCNYNGTVLFGGGTLHAGTVLLAGGRTDVASVLNNTGQITISGGDNTVGTSGLVNVGTLGMVIGDAATGNAASIKLASGNGALPARIVLNGDVSSVGTLGTNQIAVGTLGAAAGQLDLGALPRTFTIASGGASVATDLEIDAAVIGAAGGSLTKAGPGTLRLGAVTNSYSSGTTIQHGIVEAVGNGAGGALGTGSVQFTGGVGSLSASLNLRSDSVVANYGNPLAAPANGTIAIDVGPDQLGGANNRYRMGAATFGGAMDLTGSGTLELTGGGVLQSTLTLRTGGFATNDINGRIIGTGTDNFDVNIFDANDPDRGLSKAQVVSVGTVVFHGPLNGSGPQSANSYGGNTHVNAGTLILAHVNFAMDNGNYAIPHNLIIGGGTVVFAAPNQIAPGGTISFAGPPPGRAAGTTDAPGVLKLNGYAQTLSGGLAMTGGSILTDNASGAGTIGMLSLGTIGGNGATLIQTTAASTSASIGGHLTLLGTSPVLDVADGPAVDDLSISAVLSSAGGLTKMGMGNLFLGAAANPALGGTLTLGQGTLTAATGESLGTAAIVFAGGFLDVQSGASNAPVTLSGDGIINVPALRRVTYNAAISGGTLTKTGGGTLELRAANNNAALNGPIFVNGGTLNIDTDARLGTVSLVTLANGGVLQAAGSFPTARGIHLNGGGFDVLATQTLTLAGSGTLGGSGDLIKSGAGTLSLQRLYDYTGATRVTGGTLRFDTPVTQLSNNTLAGTWSVAGGATLLFAHPGNGAIAAIGPGGAVTLVSPASSFPAIQNTLLSNAGRLTVSEGHHFTTAASGTFNNSGTLTVGSKASSSGSVSLVRFAGDLQNSRIVDVSGAVIIDRASAGDPSAAIPAALLQQLHRGKLAGWDSANVATGTSAFISAAAAAAASPVHNTALGAISGAEYIAGHGGSASATFEGETISSTEASVLIKYTYNGDTDLNGIVDFDDYSRTDNGFNNNRTGWFNGDFDYNGIVDFDDYSLIDQAFNTQGSAVLRSLQRVGGGDPAGPPHGLNASAGQPAGDLRSDFTGDSYGAAAANTLVAAVPEPASSMLVLGSVLAAGVGTRQRRRCRFESASSQLHA
ncbi:MAG: autotransporter-associated beta strand repeat-containing protein, partial [Anaerolineae bacterium]|nr:autotransporter-associated beta strand repeat-containing protein [Phycisphaerae bacterium]